MPVTTVTSTYPMSRTQKGLPLRIQVRPHMCGSLWRSLDDIDQAGIATRPLAVVLRRREAENNASRYPLLCHRLSGILGAEPHTSQVERVLLAIEVAGEVLDRPSR